MMKTTRYVGLDVHGETIAAAVGEGLGRARSLGQFPNRPESVRKFIEQLGGPEGLKICYEAGPTGYALYWQLTKMGIDCQVVAPSLIPRTLTAVWVPDAAHEALRDLVRARAATKRDESRAKHRLVKYLLRNGLRHPEECRAWTHPWWRWVQAIKFDFEPQQVTLGDCVAEVLHQGERLGRLDLAIDRAIEAAPPEKRAVVEALQAMRGVAKLTAVTIVTEVGTFQRFRKPTELMGYTGSRAVRIFQRRPRSQGADHAYG
jgi:transposase